MERLEAKRVKGHTYYYYSKWARVDNRCRRVWQRYLGKLEDIVAAVQGRGPAPIAAEVFQWGLPQALWQEATRAQLVDLIDRHCPKRRQGLTTGQYLAIAAINRAISPRSKRSMWVWFSQTVLRRHMPSASEAALASQRFWTTWTRSLPRRRPQCGRICSRASSTASRSISPRSATTARISTLFWIPSALSQKSGSSSGVPGVTQPFQMRRLSPHAVVGRPQTHAKESRGWRRNGCRSRSSSGSPPWPRRSTPASRCSSSHSAPGCSLPAAAAPSPVGWPVAQGATTGCYYLLGSVGRKALAIAGVLLRILLKRLPGDGPGTPLVFAIDDSPTKRYGPHVEALASITTPLRDRPSPRSSTATSGSVWPAWSDTRSGERSPCRSSRTCTSEPKMSAGWRPTTAGSSTPSWSWPPPRSSGWSSSWGPITRRSEW